MSIHTYNQTIWTVRGHRIFPFSPPGYYFQPFNAHYVQHSRNSPAAVVSDLLRVILPCTPFTVNVTRSEIHNPLGFEFATSRRQRSPRLGVGPTALYVYYRNNFLLEAMLIVLLGYTLEYPKPEAHNLLEIRVVDGYTRGFLRIEADTQLGMESVPVRRIKARRGD